MKFTVYLVLFYVYSLIYLYVYLIYIFHMSQHEYTSTSKLSKREERHTLEIDTSLTTTVVKYHINHI